MDSKCFRGQPWHTVCLLCSFLFFVCIALVVTEVVAFSFCGFGVDSAGRLYVGRGHKIVVYENGKAIYTIKKGTSRGFAFTVQNDDTILLASGSNVYVMDLEGTSILKSWDEDSLATHKKLYAERYSYQASSGETYSASSLLGMLTISDESSVIYTMPLLDYVTLIAFILSIPGFVAYILILRNRISDMFSGI